MSHRHRTSLVAAGFLLAVAATAVAAPPVPAKPAAAPAPVGPPRRTQGNLVLEGVPETPPALAERMLQYQNARAARLFDWAPTGKGMLVGTRFAETQQLHWLAQPGGARRQLTFFAEPVQEGLVRPLRRGVEPYLPEILLRMDVGGSESYQLHLWRWQDGRTTLLTDGRSRHESPLWSRDGTRLAYVSTARNGKDFDLYAMDPDKPAEARRLAEVQGQWRLLDWSPDGKQILALRYVSILESHPHVLDVATGQLTRLFADRAGKKIAYGTLRFGDNGSIWFTSDEQGELTALGRLDKDAKDAKVAWVSQDIPWKVEALEVSQDLRQVAFAVNEDGYSAVYHVGKGGKPRRLDAVPRGIVTGLSFRPDGRVLGLSVTTPTSSGDVYTVGLDGKDLQRWTESEVGGLPESAFVAPVLVRYPTFDQIAGKPREIPLFWYKPRAGARSARNGKHAFVIAIHGGPEAQARPYFDPIVQYWVGELGLSVLIPNVRGSDGYGKTYLALDNGKLREDSVKDIGALLDWAGKQPELDPQRAAVYGGSYGGYMVLASLAAFGDRLRAGIDIVGISHFVTFLENTKDYRRDLRRVEYGDERDPDMRKFLHAISPTTLADRIRARLFVIQGANDPRVPQSEAEQIVAAVRASGQDVWYLLAKDEGHGFQKKSNRDLMGQAVVQFWERHLLGAP